jgi:hypothetical protein
MEEKSNRCLPPSSVVRRPPPAAVVRRPPPLSSAVAAVIRCRPRHRRRKIQLSSAAAVHHRRLLPLRSAAAAAAAAIAAKEKSNCPPPLPPKKNQTVLRRRRPPPSSAIRCRRRCRRRKIQLFTCKKKWSVHFTAEHLAFLQVLQKQVKKEKDAQDANANKPTATGVPKANNLKRAFRKAAAVSGFRQLWTRLVIPVGILRIPVFSSPVALFSQESRFLFLRNFLGTPSGILSVLGLRT